MKTYKGISHIVVIIIVCVVLVGGYVLFGKNIGQQSDNTNKSVVPIDNKIAQEEIMIQEGDAMMKKEDGAMMKKDEGAMMPIKGEQAGGEKTLQPIVFSGNIIAGSEAPLIDFNKADYDKALASDKLVVLYFFATWCPICQAEVSSSLYPAFNELKNTHVVGFRVNYKDSDTDTNETDLARQHGVAYQHTKVFVKNGERILKSPETWNKTRYIDEINKALVK